MAVYHRCIGRRQIGIHFLIGPQPNDIFTELALRDFAVRRDQKSVFVDAGGQPLDGANRYKIRFERGATPPVDAFWSITLYDADGFQVANTTGQLANTFAELRNRNFDLSPITVLQPKLSQKPEIDARGMLRVTGFFPTTPEELNFDMMYQAINGRWLLFGVAVDTKRVAPATASSGPAR